MAFGGLLYSAAVPGRWRGWLLLILSAAAVYTLQPAIPVRFVDFILPTLALGLAIFIWYATQPVRDRRETLLTLLLIGAVILLMAAMRYVHPDWRLTPSRPPDMLHVIGVVSAAALVSLFLLRALSSKGVIAASIGLLLLMFVVLKTPMLADAVSQFARRQTAQDASLADGATDLAWLGFSYLVFRLLHLLFECRAGRLPAVSLRTHLTYTLFFPAYTAGPIDRLERHTVDDAALAHADLTAAPHLVEALGRLIVGVFKKFVIADSLALFALNEINATQAVSAGGLWLLLYAYGLRLFFDFSGYSDIAIGLGRLYGIRLPENFDQPYRRQTITAFWQSWHMTLSQWVRFYIFSPLSRALLRRQVGSPLMVVFSAQLATMIIIGLWHGVSWNFLIWGVWHGVGLFVHKLWSDRTRLWYLSLKTRPRLRFAWTVVGVGITFHFVMLGWVWFALPDVALAWQVFLRLLGG